MQHEIDVTPCPSALTNDRLTLPGVVAGQVDRSANNIDFREQLVNDRLVGTFGAVQLPLQRITQVHGIMLDLDPQLLLPGNGLFEPGEKPCDFFARVQPVLDRHPLASKAEVRVSGTGLHVIVRLSPPVELHTAADQHRWAGAIRAVQSTLPADPRQPGITAVTRPVGSVNSKNDVVVEQLRAGRSVSISEVEDYLAEVAKAPFRQVACVLFGRDRVSPCPFCRKERSRLDCLDWFGKCYQRCGKITLAQVFNLIYADPETSTPDAAGVPASSAISNGAVQSRTSPTQTGQERSPEDYPEAERTQGKLLVAARVDVPEAQLRD
jgi:hypothetical protein